MPCLLYGVVLSCPAPRAGSLARLPLGVGGAPVSLIDVGPVAGVVATVERSIVSAPTVGSVMAYANVVEALHAERTVLPMRFGCVLDRTADVARLLGERGHIYVEVLREVQDCVEMGIRMLASHGARGTDPTPVSARQGFMTGATGLCSGARYLAERQRAYAEADQHVQEMTDLTERIRTAFHGLFVRCKSENCPRATTCPPLFSIDFLVRRASLDAFHHRFQRISRAEHTRLLLSGPWPPYNFVEPAFARG